MGLYLLAPPLQSFDPFVTISEVFTPKEVIVIRSIIEKGEKVAAKIGFTTDTSVEAKEVRSSQIMKLDSEDGQYHWIYRRLAETISMVNTLHFGFDLIGIENIQLTEYDEAYDGHYDMHIDSGWGNSSINHRKLSIVMQLSDPETYEGGELALYPDTVKQPYIAPKALGEVTLFRSNILHEAKPVTKGKRYSLVAWVHGPLPK